VGAAPGPPLGAGVTAYERHVVDVPAGASVVLYTDGLIEDRSRSIDMGLEQLRSSLLEVRLGPDAACDHVLAAMGRAGGGEDDIALLVMRHR
jgi:serine phosphatase RsbU (regulator of sigma subunit)